MEQYAVIFDVDGVLVDSYEAHFESWQLVARRHGFSISERQFATLFGRANRNIISTSWPDTAAGGGSATGSSVPHGNAELTVDRVGRQRSERRAGQSRNEHCKADSLSIHQITSANNSLLNRKTVTAPRLSLNGRKNWHKDWNFTT